jgi:hypothetical protein
MTNTIDLINQLIKLEPVKISLHDRTQRRVSKSPLFLGKNKS